jgi:hypothetical protein
MLAEVTEDSLHYRPDSEDASDYSEIPEAKFAARCS